eukprot:CAMPEP_0183341326 /NCGR_PEP_ID=MMETSP0164_2-20130417/7595_1 /TAXON_ID=221442 /ORGANISM="Coccolithus pelagicus ssp braarudi, Strain PLY182g" /LENGTH=57 /DNA_ID=CAMNT_0025511613 /DNA_START=128 /DNA_END=301 /DNA_ORIENTATION=-
MGKGNLQVLSLLPLGACPAYAWLEEVQCPNSPAHAQRTSKASCVSCPPSPGKYTEPP